MLQRHISIALFLLIFAAPSLASDTLQIRNANLLTIDEGLSQGYISNTLQDHYGFIWFCTKDGINRYDGKDFLVYNHDPSDPHSLGSNGVASITEDSNGNLWVRFFGTGADVYVRQLNRFIHLHEMFPEFPELSSSNVKWIVEREPGDFWCMTSSGMFHFKFKLRSEKAVYPDSPTSEIVEVSIQKVFGQDHPVFLRAQDSHCYKDKNNNFFISNRNHLYAIDFNTTSLFEKEILRDKFVQDKDGFRYITMVGTEKGKYIFYANKAIFYNDNADSILEYQLPFNVVASENCAVLYGNKILLLDDRGSLYAFDTNTGNTTFYQFELQYQNEKLSQRFSNIHVDREGMIWLGTGGYGVFYFHERMENFRYATTPTKHGPSLYAMTEEPDGSVMINFNYLIKKFSPQTETFIDYLHLGSDTLWGRAILREESGNYWLIQLNKLFYCDFVKNKKEFIFEYKNVNRYAELYPLVRDPYGKIWFCGYDTLFCIDPNVRSIQQRIYLPINQLSGFGPIRVHNMLYDNDSWWLATVDGLWHFDLKSGNWTGYTANPHKPDAINTDNLLWLLQDPNDANIIWIGTNGGGINKFSKSSKTFEHFTTRDGLPNNVVYAVLPDNNGKFWLSTNRGISSFDPVSHAFYNYTVSDGLQSNEFNRYSALKHSSGQLLFGGINGLTFFKPENITGVGNPPPVVIESLIGVNGPIANQYGLALDPLTTDYIELKQGQATLSVHFAALDFFAPEKNQYKYKITGLNDNWIFTGNENQIILNEIPPGEYELIIAASNADGIWNETGKTLHIKVHPAFYATWWFRAFIMAIILGAIWYIYRLRISKLLELQNMREHIARDLHDEIGSSLSSIAIYSKVALSEPGKTVEEIRPVIQRISEAAQRMLEATSDIVWAINIKNDTYKNLVQRMRASAIELTEALGMELIFDIDETILQDYVSMEKRRNLFLIFKEACNNCVKYSKAEKLHISLKQKQGKFELEITDDGNGFDVDRVEAGNGLLNMKARAAQIGGKLAVESGPGAGTSVKVIFS